MGVEVLLEKINGYSLKDKQLIIQAFEFAKGAHEGATRKSGEPYIIHPIAVACILADMGADADTIAAGLLHDTIEDCPNITKEIIARTFNNTIANLVEGVTKLKKVQFNNNKTLAEEANMRNLIQSMRDDIRIFIIKLADRLHNMRTLQFQSRESQVKNAIETLEFFVPLATCIGAYNLKKELEDLSFFYLSPKYGEIQQLSQELNREYRDDLDEAMSSVAQTLNSENIESNIKLKNINIYNLYQRICKHGSVGNVHNAFSINIIVDTKEECYRVLNLINKFFKTIPEKAKDYIKSPKSNMYSALHTTVRLKSNHMIQFQILTHRMYKINSYGITAYWRLSKKENMNPIEAMQEDISKYQFLQIIDEIANLGVDNTEFIREIKETILGEQVYPVTPKGKTIDLPQGATPVDFAYYIHTEIGDNLLGAKVNGKLVPLDTKLKSRDVVELIYDEEFIGPKADYSNICITPHAKRKIKELQKKGYII